MEIRTIQKRGRPRSVDSTLMGIKAILMEVETEMKRKTVRCDENYVRWLIHKLRSTFGHGTKPVADIYIGKIKEIDMEILQSKYSQFEHTENI